MGRWILVCSEQLCGCGPVVWFKRCTKALRRYVVLCSDLHLRVLRHMILCLKLHVLYRDFHTTTSSRRQNTQNHHPTDINCFFLLQE